MSTVDAAISRQAGVDGAEFAWGGEFTPGGRQMANTWQGAFPNEILGLDGQERTSPVTAFPPNGYGVHDMIGYLWEWTSDWYSSAHEADAAKACCIPANPRGGREEASYDSSLPNIRIPRNAGSLVEAPVIVTLDYSAVFRQFGWDGSGLCQRVRLY